MAALPDRLDHSSKTHFQSIYNQGFAPASALGGASFIQGDRNSSHQFCCNFFHPDIPDQVRDGRAFKPKREKAGPDRINNQLHSLVFNGPTGMLPVVTEKAYSTSFESDEEFHSELTSRVQNTVCFVLSGKTYHEKDVFQKPVYGDWGTPYEDLQTHYEIRDRGSVSAEHVEVILAPFHLVDAVQRVFQETVVIPVPDCRAEVSLGAFCNDTSPSRKSPWASYTKQLFAPDYQSALSDLLKTNPKYLKTGFYTHITRVPPHILPEKRAGQKKFAIRFERGEVEKVRAVQALFLAVKNPAAKRLNEFHVICDEGEQVQELQSIVYGDKEKERPETKKKV